MLRSLAPLLVALCACRPAGSDTGVEDTDDDTGDDSEESPQDDRDQDGASAEEDCDDLDPRSYPGNQETWDGRDNDCDGVIDGRGGFEGGHVVEAVAVVEGEEVHMSLTCPITLERLAGTLSFEVRCTPDADDADAQALLGAEVVVVPLDNAVVAESWQGDVEWTSSNGWTTTGIGYATWNDMDEVWFTTGLQTVSLEWSGTGSLTRTER